MWWLCSVAKEIEKSHLVKMEKRIAALLELKKMPVEERIGLIEAELYDLRNKN